MSRCRSAVAMICLWMSCSVVFAGDALTQDQMLGKLYGADIGTRMRDKTFITPEQSRLLTGKPVSMFSMYIDLAHTRNIRVTAIEFDNEQIARAMDENNINGFQVKNWFFIGTVDVKSTQDIINAIVQ
ncbi:MAG: hypothetical protein GXP09_11715 [Gammaproteobacteria bacterium]|nr:hypothetical protein [Gammaproteobacteria bacterium]